MSTVKIPPVLRASTGGAKEVDASGANVGDVLRSLAEQHPATESQLFSEEGDLNRYVNVYLNDEDVRVLDGLDTGVSDSDTIVILPAMAGGAPLIRPATAADAGAIAAQLGPLGARGLRARSCRDGHPFPPSTPERFQRAARRRRGDDGSGRGRGRAARAFDLRRTAATPTSAPRSARCAASSSRPSSWRRGVGKALMRHALADLHERGYAVATRLVVRGQRSRQRVLRGARASARDGAEREEEVWADLLEMRLRRPLP